MYHHNSISRNFNIALNLIKVVRYSCNAVHGVLQSTVYEEVKYGIYKNLQKVHVPVRIM